MQNNINWQLADNDIKPEGEVLIMYLEPFFGNYSPEIGIGYYDNPSYYEDGDGAGWLLSNNERPVHVTHWVSITPLDITIKSGQEQYIKKYGARVDSLGTVPKDEIEMVE